MTDQKSVTIEERFANLHYMQVDIQVGEDGKETQSLDAASVKAISWRLLHASPDLRISYVNGIWGMPGGLGINFEYPTDATRILDELSQLVRLLNPPETDIVVKRLKET